jgi:ABC-type amino acid transport substrate-binding protein
VQPQELPQVSRAYLIMPKLAGREEALQRGDEDFRLLVDRALSRLYASEDLHFLYAKWFGEPGEFALEFFRLSALPE